MNQIIARSAVRFGGGIFIHPIPLPPPVPVQVLPASLPMVESANGNLFVDRNDANIHWYLPDFALADDTDSSFAFVASQSSLPTEDGRPFYVGRITLSLRKFRPVDVEQFVQANPASTVQEIPLAAMVAVLSSYYSDKNGQQQRRSFTASAIRDAGGGSFLLTFDGAILGDSVTGLYQDLRRFGKALINLSASYQAWAKQGSAAIFGNTGLRLMPMQLQRVAMAAPLIQQQRPAVSNRMDVSNLNTIRIFNPGIFDSEGPAPPPPEQPVYVQLQQSWTKELPLGLKYNQDGYQLRYTVSQEAGQNHVIINVDDLRDFNQSQSQFAELKALGDISLRYPTLSRAYFGVLSRSIIVIPRRYSIVRSKSGCAATCMALVDSSPSSISGCKFEFNFTIAPDVSRIEFEKLKQEVLNSADFKGYQLTFADFEHNTPPSELLTIFKSSVQFAAGTEAHTFAVTVFIQDDDKQTPAVANANLFILRLCSQTGTDLTGSLSLKLDDGYQSAVLAPIDLNFSHTVGTDELLVEFDESSSVIKLTNRSSLDLQLSEYALVQGSNLTEFPDSLVIAAAGNTSLPLPADHNGLALLADAQLVVPKPMSISAVTDYLNFQTVDVQSTQYAITVEGSGLDYNKVASIAIDIKFSTLPQVAPRQLRLNKSVNFDSTHIVVPLENAMFSLPGLVNVSVQFVDPGVNTLLFTLQHDFTAEPDLILLQNDIDKNLPGS